MNRTNATTNNENARTVDDIKRADDLRLPQVLYEAAAHSRLAKIQADQLGRVKGLVVEQEKWKDSAQLVESHAESIEHWA